MDEYELKLIEYKNAIYLFQMNRLIKLNKSMKYMHLSNFIIFIRNLQTLIMFGGILNSATMHRSNTYLISKYI